MQDIDFYKENHKNGATVYWNNKGVKEFTAGYKDGIFDGRYQTFYEDGSVNISGFYKDGIKQGKWIVYGRNGQALKEENFNENGLRTGPAKSWSRYGKLIDYGEYKNGVLNGKRIKFDKYGNKTYEAIYKNNVVQKVIFVKPDSN